MVTVTSKIKKIFGKHDNLLRYIGAICDTKRIESNADKMVTLSNLLYSNGVEFQFLGGATNRLALQIEGYAVKFAMDEQGYLDNLIEYSLSSELQPFVTKSYETNGYILIAELVELMNNEKWELYRVDIRKVLDTLCNDYLLGDVGYIKKNMTNWGVRHNKPVILDYAYCHRFTENLFTCSRCGRALTYDSTYDKLMCTDRSGCKAIYTYNDRKRIQGKQVDIDMIKERKGESIRLPAGVLSKDIAVFDDRLLGDNVFIIDNPGDYARYLRMKEDNEMKTYMEGEDMMDGRLDALINLMRNPNDEEAKKILYENLSEEPEPVYTENYQERYMFGTPAGQMPIFGVTGHNYNDYDDNVEDDEDEDDRDSQSSLDNLINSLKKTREENVRECEEIRKKQEEEYLADLKRRQEAAAGVPIKIEVQEDDSKKVVYDSAQEQPTEETTEEESSEEESEHVEAEAEETTESEGAEEPVETETAEDASEEVNEPEIEPEAEEETTEEAVEETSEDTAEQETEYEPEPEEEVTEPEEVGEPVSESEEPVEEEQPKKADHGPKETILVYGSELKYGGSASYDI